MATIACTYSATIMSIIVPRTNANTGTVAVAIQVEQEMINSIRDVMEQAIESYPLTDFKKWCLQWPGQVILASSLVYWTADVTKVGAMRLLYSAI